MPTPSTQSTLVVSALPKEHFKENVGNVTISDISQNTAGNLKNHTCEKCGKTGHFAVCCHTGQSRVNDDFSLSSQRTDKKTISTTR